MRWKCLGLTLSALMALPLSVPADVKPYSGMVKSKPVLINDFEFMAAIQSQWIILNASSPADSIAEPIDVQLWITNRSKDDKLFSVFDTFRIVIKDASGKEMPAHGGRDATMLVKPVLIHAGETYCLSRDAGLKWSPGTRETPGSKTQMFDYTDGTGAWFNLPLLAGKYTLSFALHSSGVDQQMDFFFLNGNGPGFSWKGHPPLWSGEGVTPNVAFEVVAAPQN